MRVLILGPSKWLPGALPVLPDYLADWLPADWKRQGTAALWPLDRSNRRGRTTWSGHQEQIFDSS